MSLFDQNLQWLQQNDPELAQKCSGLEDADIILQRSRTDAQCPHSAESRISLCIIPMIRLNIPEIIAQAAAFRSPESVHPRQRYGLSAAADCEELSEPGMLYRRSFHLCFPGGIAGD